MKTDIIDIEIKKLKEREKQISKVVNRYMRIRMKRRLRKLTGIKIK
jgi:hypothetical protein